MPGQGYAMIKVEELWVRFGNIFALKNVSLEIYKGELVCIIGPNGSGKSTLMKVIAGMLKPTMGSASIYGIETWKHRRLIWHLVEFMTLDEKLPEVYDAYENIQLFSPHETVGFIKLKTDKVLGKDILEIPELHRGKKVEELSSGMRQRVNIATLSDLPITIIDEPTQGLDPNVRSRYREYLTLKDRTILWVTHDMAEAEKADRIFVLRDGLLIANAPPSIMKKWLDTKDMEEAYGIMTESSATLLGVSCAKIEEDPSLKEGECLLWLPDGEDPEGSEVSVGRLVLKIAVGKSPPGKDPASLPHLAISPADSHSLQLDGESSPFRGLCWKRTGKGN
jgi:ABC-2 type transport system ATP-binding protein